MKRGRKKLPEGEKKIALTLLVKGKNYIEAREKCGGLIKRIDK